MRVKSLQHLEKLALSRKSVRLSYGQDRQSRPLPATAVLNMTGRTILGFIRNGITVHKPKNHKKPTDL
jgi:hypothetical protein